MIVVDERDAELLAGHNWKVSTKGYVYRYERRKSVLLHREILAAELALAGKRAVIDHINGDKLDNRRTNLRVVTQRENVFNMRNLRSDNKSGVIGVHWFAGVWVAFYGRRYLGRFDTIEAAEAKRRKAEERDKTFVQKV